MTRPAPTARMPLAVAVGGAVGALLRWSLGEVVPDGDGFPWTTFAINVVGSFVLAVLPGLIAASRRPVLAVALGPGLLGTLAVCLLAVLLGGRLATVAARRHFGDSEGDV